MNLLNFEPVKRIAACKIYLILLVGIFCTGFFFCFFVEICDDSPYYGLIRLYEIYTVSFNASYILIKLLCDFLVLLLILFSGQIIYTLPLHFVIILYKGFIFGITLRILVSAYFAGGILVSAVIIIPSCAISICGYMALSCFCYHSFFKCDSLKAKNLKCIICDFLLCMSICVVALLIEFIISVILVRPLNYYF